MKNSESVARLKIVVAMIIFGTIGVFKSYIPMPSSVVAFVRGIIGSIFIVAVIYSKKNKMDFSAIKKNIFYLALSGGAIGVNWVLLFEAYNYVSIASATLYYYIAPIIVVIGSAIIYKERLTVKSVICSVVALLGMVPVSGVLSGGLEGNYMGMVFGIGAAFLYALVVLLNKKIGGISAMDKTAVQLFFAAVVLVPYIMLSGDLKGVTVSAGSLVLLLVVGIIHTGVAYTLYFGAIKKVRGSTAALLSYIDPVFAIVLSAAVSMTLPTYEIVLGGLMILGAALVNEVGLPKFKLKAK